MHDSLRSAMITQFRISHFKSLVMKKPVSLNPGLNLLIGLNSSGKSTFLQAVDFVSALSQPFGSVFWLEKRGWQAHDLLNRIKVGSGSRNSTLIDFGATYIKNEGDEPYEWAGSFSIKRGVSDSPTIYKGTTALVCLESERMIHGSYKCNCTKKGGKYHIEDTTSELSTFNAPPGFSILGSIFSHYEPESIRGFCNLASSCYSLDLLSPQQMRAHVRRRPEKGVGTGGELLGHALLDFSAAKAGELAKVMQRLHPAYESFSVKKQRGGSVRFSLHERFSDSISKLETEATHLSDGLLRLIAIVVSTMCCRGGTLLIDELEDGLNPEVMGPLLDYLAYEADCQTIVTTHSPILLSYLNDDQARSSVKLLFKDEAGISRCVPFFDLPTTKKMLDTLYPGEVMLQCDLEKLSMEACAYENEQQ